MASSHHSSLRESIRMALTILGPLSIILVLPYLTSALSSCGRPCKTLIHCHGELTCINGKCNDDPYLGTNICSNPSPTSSGGQGCRPAGTIHCGEKSYTTYNCSPPVTSSTHAKLTNKELSNFSKGKCDGKYYYNSEPVVALSTGWYAGGSRCGKMISITANNGKTTTAEVVDECDSMHGCDHEEHFAQIPCQNNIVDASNAVWNDLGLNKDFGMVDVTWAMAYIL